MTAWEAAVELIRAGDTLRLLAAHGLAGRTERNRYTAALARYRRLAEKAP